ncbi:hypothetical protein NF27_CY00050 [Candidatus Jidaibacter acanthamoeba]|uniref:Uncharacterized protein n=1 Tax=Candidatus Jidaibacter acanthamoebae TaxID=86105 RepID=A0A0C1QJT6_9RICK|nr:hypothetical protein [Candidatus Jidaibacter acanthamoeba]KIE05769.1 hypothetical protein NF27_CY00050 [Candidatus Jidaibacter acanthamoeba]
MPLDSSSEFSGLLFLLPPPPPAPVLPTLSVHPDLSNGFSALQVNLKLVFSLLELELLELELPDLCPVEPELSEPLLVEPELPGF